MRIGFFSAKGGVGKTIISINVASLLSESGKNVLVVDTDENNSASISIGLINFPQNLSKVLKGIININQAIYPTNFGFKILPAGEELKEFNSSIFNSLNFDYIIFDTEPGISRKNLEIAKICDEIFLITQAETISIYAILRTLKEFEKENIKVSGLIINRFNKKSIDPSEVYDFLGIPIVAILKEEKNMQESLLRGIPYVFLDPFSNFSIELKNFASKFFGIHFTKPLFYKIFRILRWI